MSEEAGNCQLREAEFSSHAGKSVSEDMRRNLFEASPGTDPIEDTHHTDEMPVAPIGQKYKWRVISHRLSNQEVDGCLTDDTHLLARLRVREANAVLLRPDPHPMHSQDFQATEAGQQHRADGGETGRMLTLTLHCCHRRTENDKFISAQPTELLVARDHANAQSWVGLNEAMASGVTKQTSEGADGPTGNASTAPGLATTIPPPRPLS